MEYNFIIKDEDQLHHLKEEKILVYYDLPIMFVCIDEYNIKYLVLCTDAEQLNYILVTVSDKDILDMIDQKRTMYDIFNLSNQKWRIKTAENIKNDEVLKIKEFEENELPEKNVFYQIFDKTIYEYKEKLNTENIEDFHYSPIDILNSNAFNYYTSVDKYEISEIIKNTDICVKQKFNFSFLFLKLFNKILKNKLKKQNESLNKDFTFSDTEINCKGWNHKYGFN